METSYNTGRIDYSDFSEQLQHITGRSAEEIGEVFQRTDFIKNTALLSYIAELHKKYKIGLLSNVAGDRVRQYILSTEDQALFDDMVFSYDIGMTKPDRRVFELACERLKVRPEEAVMVDDIQRHYDGAKQAGLQAILYQNFVQFKDELVRLLANSDD